MIVVVGAGAVGTFLGATLATGGEDVALLRRGGPPGVRRETVRVDGPGHESRSGDLTVAGSPEAVAAAPDLVVLAVKMPDLPGALATASTWPDAVVLAVENGVGADDMVRDARLGDSIAGSLTASVVLDRATGTVRRLSRGGIGLAPVHGVSAPLNGSVGADPTLSRPSLDGVIERLVTRFVTGGLTARRLADADAMRWSKLLANLLGNATSAILDSDPADVYRDPGLFDIEQRQLREALAVLRAMHLRPLALPGADVRPLALAARLPPALVRPLMSRAVGGGRGGKSPSLRLHLQAGAGQSEAQWLNGAVARAAERLGRRAPVNARLAELVESCDRDPERWAWFRGRPDRLIAELRAT
jgi:2-dehydropantoate 2-reductase